MLLILLEVEVVVISVSFIHLRRKLSTHFAFFDFFYPIGTVYVSDFGALLICCIFIVF